MPLDWDNEEEDEEVTVIEYRKRPQNKVIVHDEVTVPLTAEEAQSDAPPRPQVRRKPVVPPAEFKGPELAPGEVVASPQERLTAFCIDSLVVFYLYWIIGGVLNWVLGASSLNSLHNQVTAGWILHFGLTFCFAMAYYIFFESTSGATWGKMFCGLKVVDASGHKPSFGNAVIRNIMRIMDYQLFFLVAVILMESSHLHQRLGDRAAQTLVIKVPKVKASPYDLRNISLGSTFSRCLAELIDMCLAFILAYGFILIPSFKAPIQYPTLAYTLLISGPIVFLSYYILLEAFTETTPGKLIFKRKVIKDNGENLDTTSAFIRNLFRPIDYLIGYVLLAMTPKKQRLGDLAANTLVVVKPNSKKAVLGSFIAIFFVIVIGFLGFRNSHSLIREKFNSGPLSGLMQLISNQSPVFSTPIHDNSKALGTPPGKRPQNKTKPKATQPPQKNKSENPWAKSTGQTNPKPDSSTQKTVAAPANWGDELQVVDFSFGIGPLSHHKRPDAKFKPNERIFAKITVKGAKLNAQGQYSVIEGYKVTNANGEIKIDRPTAVRRPGKPNPEKPIIELTNFLKQYEPGTYQAVFEIKDTISGKKLTLEKSFTVSP